VNDLNHRLGGLDGVRTQAVALEEPFPEMAARFAGQPGTVVLLSGGELDCARYHILGIHPWLTLDGRREETRIVIDGATWAIPSAPLDVLETVLDHCRINPGNGVGPVAAGLFGYLAYDLKDGLESLPRTGIDDLGLPHLFLVAPQLIVVHDKTSGRTVLHAPVRRGRDTQAVEETIQGFLEALKSPPPASGHYGGAGQRMRSNFSRPDYLTAVQQIKDYIAAGDVYQVNLSQRFETGFDGDGFALFNSLYQINPAPFFAYINAGDHQIVSTSPERFLLRSGGRVETRPIKGTRPRGKTPQEDREMREALTISPKDDAELSMIVDLLRNDLGKVCTGGSVVVVEHKRLEAYRNVYHLVSVVSGALAEKKSSVDLIRATFPGGSITGCPKIRAMEIIDELESHCRHLYTGAIGYISFHDTLDLSIAIRTATIVANRLLYSVGGGIVHDSDPEEEYAETLHKGQTLASALEDTGIRPAVKTPSISWVWQNGRLIGHEQAVVSVFDLGLQYGFGFFETLRVEKGAACHLSAHLARFNRTWAALFGLPPPDLTWPDIIDQVVTKNGLGEATAAVKILATRGDDQASRFNGTLLVSARPYTPRLAAIGAPGLNVATYPHPRVTPLADHKTLNYLYYHQAGRWAIGQGADEALILNADGTVSETNSANILVFSGNTVLRPQSLHVLPGVMTAVLCRRLVAQGYGVIECAIRPEALRDAHMVLLTNALMGAVPVLSLDGWPLAVDNDQWVRLNHRLYGAAATNGYS
jgi:para-aminobenzoate synthetase component I